jgi:CO/xanthine dehydrogenase FAD-binding subunit
MKNFEYLEPRTLEEAAFFLTEYGDKARVLAGGTYLIVQMKLKKQTPKYLINIKNISELDYIGYDNKFLRIGALTTFSALAQSKMIQENFSILMDSVRAVGPLQIRNRGTIAGNIHIKRTLKALMDSRLRFRSMVGKSIVSFNLREYRYLKGGQCLGYNFAK